MDFLENQVDGYGEGDEAVIWNHKKFGYRDKEPAMYRDLAEGKNKPTKGLFKVLVSTKMNRMVFTAMVICFALIFIISILNGKPNQGTVNGVFCEMTAFSFDEDVYVSVAMKDAGGKKKTISGPKELSLKFIAVNSDNADSDSSEVEFVFNPSGENVCRTTFKNYELIKIKANVKCGNDSEDLNCAVEYR